ncbi:MAG: hypothetical protein ACYDAR_14235, partial [Thermomicrobiales bacterium]
ITITGTNVTIPVDFAFESTSAGNPQFHTVASNGPFAPGTYRIQCYAIGDGEVCPAGTLTLIPVAQAGLASVTNPTSEYALGINLVHSDDLANGAGDAGGDEGGGAAGGGANGASFVVGSDSMDDRHTAATPTRGTRRMLFDKITGAFRAGTSLTSKWDAISRGIASFAAGYETTAAGAYATAAGKSSSAASEAATAIGENCTADTGVGAVALGETCHASAEGASAIGTGATASAKGAVAHGEGCTASAEGAAAIGLSCSASGKGGFAGGEGTQANSEAAVALGFGTLADTAKAAVALGENTHASAESAIAAGNGAVASATAAVALCENTTASGEAALAAGKLTTASAIAATALGEQTTASAEAAVASGANADPGGDNVPTTSSGRASHALGQGCAASGPASIATGLFGRAIADVGALTARRAHGFLRAVSSGGFVIDKIQTWESASGFYINNGKPNVSFDFTLNSLASYALKYRVHVRRDDAAGQSLYEGACVARLDAGGNVTIDHTGGNFALVTGTAGGINTPTDPTSPAVNTIRFAVAQDAGGHTAAVDIYLWALERQS